MREAFPGSRAPGAWCRHLRFDAADARKTAVYEQGDRRRKIIGDRARVLFFHELLHQQRREAVGIVAHHAVDFEEIVEQASHPHPQ